MRARPFANRKPRPAATRSPWVWVPTIVLLLVWGAALGVAGLYMGRVNYGMELFRSYLENRQLLVLNLLPPLVLTLFFLFLTNRVWGALLGSAVCALVPAMVNYYKLLLRGDPLLMGDAAYLAEASNMLSSKYALPFSRTVVLAGAVALIAVIVSIFLFRRVYIRHWQVRWPLAVIAAAAGALLLVNFYQSGDIYTQTANFDVEFADGATLSQWSDRDNYVCRGFYYSFLHSSVKLHSQKPDGYSSAAAAEALEKYTPEDLAPEQKVSVMAVMLESYSDFSGLGTVQFGHNPYSYMHKLMKEGVSGTLVTNIFAGGTIDTERCFITGSPELIEYRAPADSYVRWFSAQGYKTAFCHPGYDWFYNRRNVAEYLGFDEAHFFEDRYGNPDGTTILNDDAFFADLIDLYEEATADGSPYFNFSVTYQNHGPYVQDYLYDGSIQFACMSTMSKPGYNIFNNYLWGIDKTDDALKDFIGYFRKQDKPVVVVLFGDHKPWLGDGSWVYDELQIDLSCQSADSFYTLYGTPWVIWANDAAKQALGEDFTGEGGSFSPCFLMQELFDRCGFTGDASIQAARAARSRTDVIHESGVFREDGALVQRAQLSEDAAQAVDDYLFIQYARTHLSTERALEARLSP